MIKGEIIMSWHGYKEPECVEKQGPIALMIEPQPRDLGGFQVRRALPAPQRQMAGPFIFLDHAGPARLLAPGQSVDVRPHPHIGLGTVAYLFEGAFLHRDSLGSKQLIEPGAVNWMTAGRGIVHSERTPPGYRARGGCSHSMQSWVALSADKEETESSFQYYLKDSLPMIKQEAFKCGSSPARRMARRPR
jgi:redox-sensitive bicupin YhaK (pirin superfamily)